MDTKSLADELVLKHQTRNPFTIADDMGYIVLFVPLKNVRGFYKYAKRCSIIYINNELDDTQSKLVCAHELLHSMEHKGSNRMFMDNHTRIVTNKFEIEADHFSVDLVYDDDTMKDLIAYPIQTVANVLGVSEQLAAYRMSSINPEYLIGIN